MQEILDKKGFICDMDGATPTCPIRGKSKWNFSECCKNKLR